MRPPELLSAADRISYLDSLRDGLNQVTIRKVPIERQSLLSNGGRLLRVRIRIDLAFPENSDSGDDPNGRLFNVDSPQAGYLSGRLVVKMPLAVECVELFLLGVGDESNAALVIGRKLHAAPKLAQLIRARVLKDG